MYLNGQPLDQDRHFEDHIVHEVPIQVYYNLSHTDVGFIEKFCPEYVVINNMFYRRAEYTFISRPGY